MRYLECEVGWRWPECGRSWQLSCSMKLLLVELCEFGEVEVGRPSDGYKRTRGDWDIAADLCE